MDNLYFLFSIFTFHFIHFLISVGHHYCTKSLARRLAQSTISYFPYFRAKSYDMLVIRFTSTFPAIPSAVPSILLTTWWESTISSYKICRIFESGFAVYSEQTAYLSDVQRKAARAILNCKSGKLSCNISKCTDCGHMEIHNNSCRNPNCPNCQAVLTKIWADKRRAEVIESPYFHVVFTLPHELIPLLYCNHELLYGLLHRCSTETLLELSAGKKQFTSEGIIILR